MNHKIINRGIKITDPFINDFYYHSSECDAICSATIIDYGNSHLIYNGKDLGRIEDLSCMSQELYYYKREYRYLLKLLFGEIKNPKTAKLKTMYKKELEELNVWFSQEKKHNEDLRK